MDYQSIEFKPFDPTADENKYKYNHWHLTGMRIGPHSEIGWKYFETIRRALFVRFWRYAGINPPEVPGVLNITLSGWSTFVNGLPDSDFDSPGAPPGKYKVMLTDVGDEQIYANRVYFDRKTDMLNMPPISGGEVTAWWKPIASPHIYAEFDQTSGKSRIELYEKGSKPEPPLGTYKHFYVDLPAWRWLPKQLHPLKQRKPVDDGQGGLIHLKRYVEPNRRYIAQNAAAGTRHTLTVEKAGSAYNLVKEVDGVKISVSEAYGGLEGGRYTNIYAEPGMSDTAYHNDSLPRQSAGQNYGSKGTANQWGFEPKICASYQEMIGYCAERLPWVWPILPDTPQGAEFIRNFNGERFGWADLWTPGVYETGDVVRWPDNAGQMCGWTATPFTGQTSQEPGDDASDWEKIYPYGYGLIPGRNPPDPIAAYMDDERWGCNGSATELALWITSNTDGLYDWVYDTDKPFAPMQVLKFRCKELHGYPLPSDQSINNAYPLAHGNWHRCWPGMGWPKNIDPDNGGLVLPGVRYVTDWHEGIDYAAGVRRYGQTLTQGEQSTDVYRCKVAHTSTMDTYPGGGGNWQTYWEPIFNFQKNVIPPNDGLYHPYQDFTLSDQTIAAGAGVIWQRLFWPGLYNKEQPTVDYAALDINAEDIEQMHRRHNRAIIVDGVDAYEVSYQQVKALWDVLSCLVYIEDMSVSITLQSRTAQIGSTYPPSYGSSGAAWNALVQTALATIDSAEWVNLGGIPYGTSPNLYLQPHNQFGWTGYVNGINGEYSAGGSYTQMRLKITGGYVGGKYYGGEIWFPLLASLGGHFLYSWDTDLYHFETCVAGIPGGSQVSFRTLSFLDDPPPPYKVRQRLVMASFEPVSQYAGDDTHYLYIPQLTGPPTAPSWPDDNTSRWCDSHGYFFPMSGYLSAIYRLDFSRVPASVFA